jgi:hypothetical protein
MKRALRIAAFLVGIAALLLVGWYAGLIYSFHHAEISYDLVGGAWYLERSDNPLWERSPRPKLVRKVDGKWKQVDSWVSVTVFLGDDCVLYSRLSRGKESFFAVCDEHTPVFLADDEHGPVSIGSDGLVRYELTGSGKKTVEVVSATSVRARARAAAVSRRNSTLETRSGP